MARGFWVVLGAVSLVLGLIGVVLPVLPTTPFILLAAFAFSRGSPRLHAWLEGHARFGPVITDWRANGAIAPRHKILAVGMMAATLAASILFAVATVVLVIQTLCMAGAALFVLTRPNGSG
ncbi:MAG: DUF454 domain-containing protein [Rhodobacteraceae bacterium]|nr:MAG: DUF454 domain-containing protein [Paracoccaceae bacterium]